MGVASGCGEQEVGVASGSGWNLWVWLLGVVVRRYRIAGNFGLVQIFVYFVRCLAVRKYNLRKVLHSKFLSRQIHVYLPN